MLITSERLYLKEIEFEDIDFLYKLHQDPEVMRYIGPLRERSEIESRVNKIQEAYLQVPGLGIWLACINQSNKPVGWFNLNDLDGNPEIEIGYRLSPPYWGKGYATEMSQKLLEYGFKTLRLDKIVAVAVPQNTASIRVLEKIGLQYFRKGWYYNTWVNFYQIMPGSGKYL